MDQKSGVVFLFFLLSTGVVLTHSRKYEISERKATYQKMMLTKGITEKADPERTIEVQVIRIDFDRELYIGRKVISEIKLQLSRDGIYYQSPILGEVNLECVCANCPDDPKFCANGHCTFRSGFTNVSEARLIVFESVNSMAEHLKRLFFYENDDLILDNFPDGNQLTLVLITKEWENFSETLKTYVPNELDLSRCRVHFNDHTSGLLSHLHFLDNEGAQQKMGGYDTKFLTQIVPSCDAKKMKNSLDEVMSIAESLKDASASDTELILFRLQKIQGSSNWINCMSAMESIYHSEKVEVLHINDTNCRFPVLSEKWMTDPCCNTRLLESQCCVEKNITSSYSRLIEPKKDVLKKVSMDSKYSTSIAARIIQIQDEFSDCDLDPVKSRISEHVRYSLRTMVEDCEKELGFNEEPSSCVKDSECPLYCDRQTKKCVSHYNNRINHTISCWNRTMDDYAWDSLKRVLNLGKNSGLNRVQDELERIATQQDCLGKTAWDFRTRTEYLETDSCEEDEKDCYCTQVGGGRNSSEESDSSDTNSEDVQITIARDPETLCYALKEIEPDKMECINQRICNWDVSISDAKDCHTSEDKRMFCGDCKGNTCRKVSKDIECSVRVEAPDECQTVYSGSLKKGDDRICILQEGETENSCSESSYCWDFSDGSHCGGYCVLKDYTEEMCTPLSSNLIRNDTDFGKICSQIVSITEDTMKELLRKKDERSTLPPFSNYLIDVPYEEFMYNMLRNAHKYCKFTELAEMLDIWEVDTEDFGERSDFQIGGEDDLNWYYWVNNTKGNGFCNIGNLWGINECSEPNMEWIPWRIYEKGQFNDEQSCIGKCTAGGSDSQEECEQRDYCDINCGKCLNPMGISGYCYINEYVTPIECSVHGGHSRDQICFLPWISNRGDCQITNNTLPTKFKDCEYLDAVRCTLDPVCVWFDNYPCETKEECESVQYNVPSDTPEGMCYDFYLNRTSDKDKEQCESCNGNFTIPELVKHGEWKKGETIPYTWKRKDIIQPNVVSFNTKREVLKDIMKEAMILMESQPISERLLCKYSPLIPEYEALSCEQKNRGDLSCWKKDTLYPEVQKVEVIPNMRVGLKSCSVFSLEGPFNVTLRRPGVLPKELGEIIRRKKEDIAKKENDNYQITPAIATTGQRVFDVRYTAYARRNSVGDFRFLISKEGGGVTKREKDEILSVFRGYVTESGLEPYAVVMNKKNTVIGQVSGTPVSIIPEEEDTTKEITLCFPYDARIPLDKETFPVPDIGIFSDKLNTFEPMEIELIGGLSEGEICGKVNISSVKEVTFAPIYRYEDWKEVERCVYDACFVCNGDNSTCSGCDKIPYSGLKYDMCEKCGGDNSTCTDCEGVLFGDAKRDDCGVCGGDNSTCYCCPGWKNPPACDVEDLCYNTRCINGGVCAETTGLCSCPMGFTGSNCEFSDCNTNGFFSRRTDECVCNRGWAGENCTTCGNPKRKDYEFVCVPKGNGDDISYTLVSIPKDLAEVFTTKEGQNISLSNSLLRMRDVILEETTKRLIKPGDIGHNGYMVDCSCRYTSVHRDNRTLHEEDIQKLPAIPESKNSKTKIPQLFTKNELYVMSKRGHLPEDLKTVIRTKNRMGGLLFARDTEAGPYDDLVDQCVTALGYTSEEIESLTDYFGAALSKLRVCTEKQSEKECGPNRGSGSAAFWGVAAWAITSSVIIVLLLVYIVGDSFKVSLLKGAKRRLNEVTVTDIGKRQLKSNRVRVSKEKRRRKKKKGL